MLNRIRNFFGEEPKTIFFIWSDLKVSDILINGIRICPFPPCNANLEYDGALKLYYCKTCHFTITEETLKESSSKEYLRLGIQHTVTFIGKKGE